MDKNKLKYLPSPSALIDRLVICQLKELKIPEHRDKYTAEINEILNDLDVHFGEKPVKITAELVRNIIINAVMNDEIWFNEANFRKGIRRDNHLELTHGLNGIRNTAMNKIQENLDPTGRKDYKVDNVEAFKEWIPSGY